MYVNTEIADKYQEFFNFMSQEHNLTLTISEMDEIVREAQNLVKKFETDSESALRDKIISVLNDIQKMDLEGEWYGFMHDKDNAELVTKLWNYCR